MSMRYRENESGGGFTSGVIGHYYREDSLGNVKADRDIVLSTLPPARVHVNYERCWDELHPGPPYRQGGPFNKWDYRDGGLVPQPAIVQTFDAYDGLHQYKGMVINTLTPAQCHPFANSVLSDLDKNGHNDGFGDCTDDGARAWHKFKPGQPGADLAVFLAESADLTRMLRTTALGFVKLWKSLRSRSGRNLAKTVAQQHLNTQFGWLPFVSDVRKLYNTHKDAERRLAQIKRDNGQWVQRKGTVGTSTESEVLQKSTKTSYTYPTEGNFNYRMFAYPKGSCTLIRRLTERTWFSARFRYWIPNIESPLWGFNAYRKLQGLSITPEVLWELVPWSWLIDWFTGFGDIVSAYSGDSLVNNLAAKYAYIMRHTKMVATLRSTWNLADGSTPSWEFPYEIERKQRVSANPFGFGLTDADLSIRQLSILAALGIDRGL